MNCIKRQFISRTILLFTVFILASEINAQTDSATSVGSTLFKIKKSKNFWMGSNYRKEWTTPVKAPVLNLATEHGGLTPVRLGGGKQTKSLRMEDAQGRQYTLRSIQKFITFKTLPPDLQSEAAEDLVSDGVSASYPYSTISMPPLADAAGVPYGKVKLVYIPDDARLGDHRKDFANILALFEERLPENVKKGYDTDEVVEKMKEDNDDDVDQHALLRARILDMYVMDFDRHEDQWQWGANDKEKGKRYFPIPRDRDQAFFINDGILPGMLKRPWLVPQLEGFKPKAISINRFNFAARNLDRFFLNELSEQDWKKDVDDFLPKMTDELIEKSINQQPAEIRSISGNNIVNVLKARRQYLASEVMQYYRFLAETVSITGSDKKELFNIVKNNDGSVLVQVFKISKEGVQTSKMYERTFYPADTKEIRMYAFGDDDKFEIKGTDNRIKIRLIGGSGNDVFESAAGGKAIVYDLKSEKNKISGNLIKKLGKDTSVNSFNRLNFKYDQIIPFLSFNYNVDDGLFLGFSLKFINQGFRKEPYKNMHEFMISHALATNAFSFRYTSEYINLLGKKVDLLTDIDIKAPNNTTNFFGFGNQSIYDKTKPGNFRYYRARYNLGNISALLRKKLTKNITLSAGPTFQFYSMDKDENKGRNIVINTTGLDVATLYEKQLYFGFKSALEADTRNNKVSPTKGVFFQSSYNFLSGLNESSYELRQLNGDFTFYLSLIKDKLILANRTGGGYNFGFNAKVQTPELMPFEFYQAQYLGGEDNLRGYRKYRFAGRGKLFNNTELRLKLANLRTYLFPATMGLLAFYDTGTILDDDPLSKNKMLSGYGGGFWFSPLKKLVISASVGISEENALPVIGIGWKF